MKPSLAPIFTPDLLNEILNPSPATDPVKVVAIRQQSLTGPRNYNASLYRLSLTYDRPSTAAPKSLIAKLPTTNPELNVRAATFQPGARENWFYHSAAPHSPIHAPRCYYNTIDASTGQSVLLLEDLTPALPGNPIPGATLQQAELALESVARLHARWWAKATDPEIRALTQMLSAAWDEEQNLVQALYDSAWPRFLQQAAFPIPDDVRKFGAAIVGHMKAVDALLDQVPKTLAHGDFRLENILFGEQDGKAACWLIDWEDVFFGSGLIDVSWFLGSCLPVDAGRHEIDLLRHYHQALADAGVQDYTWDQCYADYRRAMCGAFVQGILSATPDDNASEYGHQLAQALGQRFSAIVRRLELLQ
jgi:hypothetical protein